MKQFKKSLTVTTLIASMVLMSGVLFSCGEGAREQARQERLAEVKADVEQELSKFKTNINDRIRYLDEQIEEASGETEENLKEARAGLVEQRDRLDAELERVRAAEMDEWNEVVSEVSVTLGQVRAKTNEISREVREMLD